MPRCLRLTVTCGKTPTTVTSSKPLKICCHIVVTQQRPTVEQSERKLRNLRLVGKERIQALITSLYRTMNLAGLQCECHTRK